LGTLDKSAPIETQSGFYTLLLKDKDGTTLRVRHRGIKPVNIEHADSIVARGSYSTESGFFEADKILVKCPSRYAKKAIR
jgi:cytochrome c-type biogenesis protein CcmE